MGEWSRADIIAVSSLAATLVLGGLAAVAAWLVVPEFRSLLRAAGRRRRALGQWLLRNWQLVLGLILLCSVPVAIYGLSGTWRAALVTLGMEVAFVLLARYERTAFTFSGEGIGDFSDSRKESWAPTVVCDPPFPDWIRLKGADWVWIKNHPTDQEAQEGQTVWHRVRVDTPGFPWKLRSTTLNFVVDDFASVFVNGALVRRREKGGAVIALDVGNQVHPGKNLIEMEIENAPMQGATWDMNLAGITFVLDMRLGLF